MIGNNRHSDRTFVSEHICGRLAPSAGHADARPLSRPPAFTLATSLSLPLDIVPPLFPRVPSLFFIPVPSCSLVHVHPMSYSLGLLSRSSLLSSPFPFVSARPPLFSRHCSSFHASLSAVVHKPPSHAARSVLIESTTRSPPRRRVHLRILLALTFHPFRRSISVSIRFETALYFSLSLYFVPFFSPSFSLSPAFSFSDQRFFARRLCSVWCVRYVGYTSYNRACAYVCTQVVLLALISLRGNARVRIASIAFMGEKKWADVSSALVTAACKYAATEHAHAPRVHWVSGGTSPVSFCFLFVSAPAFRIYLPVIRFAARYNTRPASDGCDSCVVAAPPLLQSCISFSLHTFQTFSAC